MLPFHFLPSAMSMDLSEVTFFLPPAPPSVPTWTGMRDRMGRVSPELATNCRPATTATPITNMSN